MTLAIFLPKFLAKILPNLDSLNFIFPFFIPFCRHFNLRMKRDTSLFSDEFKVETSNTVLDYDTSHIYTGHIYGKLNLKRTLFFNIFLHRKIYMLKHRQIFQKRWNKFWGDLSISWSTGIMVFEKWSSSWTCLYMYV